MKNSNFAQAKKAYLLDGDLRGIKNLLKGSENRGEGRSFKK